MAAGTRLELRPGVRVGQIVQVRSAATAQTPPAHWGLAPVTGLGADAVWRVASGEATLAGHIQTDAPIVKDGAGTLRLAGAGFSPGRALLTVAQGGLRIDQLWWGPVLTRPGTVLSGVGQVDEARVAGQLRPGAPDRTGTLLIGQRLALLPDSQTRIRIDAGGQADRIWSFGTARLGGGLAIEPAPGSWTPDRRWMGQLGVQIRRSWAARHGDALMTLDLGVRRLWGGSPLASHQAYRADPGRRFEVEGPPLPRYVLRLDLGVQAPVARRIQVALAYTGQHGGGQMQHGLWLGVKGGFR